jgi:O-antigen ligase
MSQERRSQADLLALAGGLLLLVALPVVMVFANRASAAILALVCSLMIVARVLGPERKDLFSFAFRGLMRPAGLLIVAFFVLALAGIPRTAHPQFHLWRLGEAFVPVATAMLLLLILPAKNLVLKFWMLALGLTLAAGLVFIELAQPAVLRRIFGLREEVFRLNRALVTLVMLLPALGVLAETRWQRISAFIVGAIVVVAAFRSDSATSALAALVLGTASLLAWLSWKWISRLTLAGTLLAIVTAPFHAWLLDRMIPHWLHERLSSASSAIRVKIYSAFDAAIAAAPFFGSGFNSASRFKDEPAFQFIPPQLQSYVEFGHPHNAAVQLWVELGLAGVVIVCALVVLAFRALDRLPEQMRPLALGFWAAVVAVAIVSHGAWQAWWLALVGIGIVVFAARSHDLAASRDRA